MGWKWNSFQFPIEAYPYPVSACASDYAQASFVRHTHAPAGRYMKPVPDMRQRVRLGWESAGSQSKKNPAIAGFESVCCHTEGPRSDGGEKRRRGIDNLRLKAAAPLSDNA